jgi:hypothetical protein
MEEACAVEGEGKWGCFGQEGLRQVAGYRLQVAGTDGGAPTMRVRS